MNRGLVRLPEALASGSSGRRREIAACRRMATGELPA